ncbi:MAG: hypothetical protein IT452_14345 [Planctomycetia bacterium]|nr:hypothetical protein [Planctomycetia bacterium]
MNTPDAFDHLLANLRPAPLPEALAAKAKQVAAIMQAQMQQQGPTHPVIQPQPLPHQSMMLPMQQSPMPGGLQGNFIMMPTLQHSMQPPNLVGQFNLSASPLDAEGLVEGRSPAIPALGTPVGGLISYSGPRIQVAQPTMTPQGIIMMPPPNGDGNQYDNKGDDIGNPNDRDDIKRKPLGGKTVGGVHGVAEGDTNNNEVSPAGKKKEVGANVLIGFFWSSETTMPCAQFLIDSVTNDIRWEKRDATGKVVASGNLEHDDEIDGPRSDASDMNRVPDPTYKVSFGATLDKNKPAGHQILDARPQKPQDVGGIYKQDFPGETIDGMEGYAETAIERNKNAKPGANEPLCIVVKKEIEAWLICIYKNPAKTVILMHCYLCWQGEVCFQGDPLSVVSSKSDWCGGPTWTGGADLDDAHKRHIKKLLEPYGDKSRKHVGALEQDNIAFENPPEEKKQ